MNDNQINSYSITTKIYTPKYIRQEADLRYGGLVTHEDWNEKLNLNMTQGDYNTEVLASLFTESNVNKTYRIPYLDTQLGILNHNISAQLSNVNTQVNALHTNLANLTNQILITNKDLLKVKTDLLNRYTKNEVDTLIKALEAGSSVKGIVETEAELPTEGVENNWVYLVGTDATQYAQYLRVHDRWYKLGASIDLTNYYTRTETEILISDNIVDNNTTQNTITDNKISSANTQTILESKQYTDTQINSLDLSDKVNRSEVLTKTNTTEYEPTEPYHPMTLKYFEDHTGGQTTVSKMIKRFRYHYDPYIGGPEYFINTDGAGINSYNHGTDMFYANISMVNAPETDDPALLEVVGAQAPTLPIIKKEYILDEDGYNYTIEHTLITYNDLHKMGTELNLLLTDYEYTDPENPTHPWWALELISTGGSGDSGNTNGNALEIGQIGITYLNEVPHNCVQLTDNITVLSKMTYYKLWNKALDAILNGFNTLFTDIDGSTFGVKNPNFLVAQNIDPNSPFGAPLYLGDQGGEARHTLTVAEMPSHTHQLNKGSTPGGNDSGVVFSGTTSTNDAGVIAKGGGKPHNNLPPYTVANFFICYDNAPYSQDLNNLDDEIDKLKNRLLLSTSAITLIASESSAINVTSDPIIVPCRSLAAVTGIGLEPVRLPFTDNCYGVRIGEGVNTVEVSATIAFDASTGSAEVCIYKGLAVNEPDPQLDTLVARSISPTANSGRKSKHCTPRLVPVSEGDVIYLGSKLLRAGSASLVLQPTLTYFTVSVVGVEAGY